MTFVLRSRKMLFMLASARCEGLAASGSADEIQLICVMDTAVSGVWLCVDAANALSASLKALAIAPETMRRCVRSFICER